MNMIINIIVAFFTGIFASLGLGGGMILIIYLTIFGGVSQLTAQGVNLIFFIPIAIFSLIFHTRNKLVEWKKIIPAIICGIIGAILGTFLANWLGSKVLTKMFAVFVLFVGLKELFYKGKD